jgi:hypothetical protein
MISVADRVLHAIDSFERGEFEFALTDAAIAIDISAQSFFNKTHSSRRDYKQFISQNFWLIELMALNGLDLEKTTFHNFVIPKVANPKFGDLIYHLIRCSLVHDTGLPGSVRFEPGNKVTLADNFISLPISVFWGLLSIVVFAKVNALEKSAGEYFLSYTEPDLTIEHKFLIREYWGKEDEIRLLYQKHVTTRVELISLTFRKPAAPIP